MATRWIEGFENARNETYLNRKYRSQSGVAGFVTGKHGGYAGRWDTDGYLYTKALTTANENEWYITWRQKVAANTGAGTPGDAEFMGLIFFADTDSSLTEQVALTLERVTNNSYQWKLYRGADRSGSLIATSSSFWAERWYHFQLKVILENAPNGAYELKIDGTTDVSGSSVDLSELSTNEGADSIGFKLDAQFATAVNVDIDDIIMNDSTGTANNTFSGDGIVRGELPDSDGTHSEWTPSTGSDHYALVDDSDTSPSDSDFVSAESDNLRDLWGYGAITKIKDDNAAIQINTYAAMQSSGSRDFKHYMESNGTETEGSTTFTLSDVAWNCFSEVVEEDPDTTAAWTASGLNAAEFGIKTVA